MTSTNTNDDIVVTYKYSSEGEDSNDIQFTSLSGFSAAPTRAHPSDAGADLRSLEDVYLEPGERALVDTGVSLAIPEGFVGLVCSRSGLAAKYGVSVANSPGVIDSSYRGPIKVILQNLGNEAWTSFAGERVAQLVVLKVELPNFVYSESLDSTARGDGGFGSTGVQ